MFKKRMLLLVAALGAFGAMMVGSTFANVQGTASTVGTGATSAQPIGEIGAQYANIDNLIPANGLPQKVADVQAYENDPDYDVDVLSAAITNNGIDSGNCSTGTTWALANFTDGDLVPVNTWEDVYDLRLTIPLAADHTCSNSGAVVTVTFQVVG